MDRRIQGHFVSSVEASLKSDCCNQDICDSSVLFFAENIRLVGSSCASDKLMHSKAAPQLLDSSV